MSIRTALDFALDHGEIGIQVAAYAGDELVVDAHAGRIRPDADAPEVSAQTVFPIFSVTKAIVSVAVYMQADRGLLDLDEPIATYWPEFAIRGKGSITVAHVLAHRGGVPQMPADLTPVRLKDWDWIVGRLEAMEPYCPPGVRNTYHSYSYGYLLGEVVRRTDPLGRDFSQWIVDEICEPLSLESLWVGTPPEVEDRIATLVCDEERSTPIPGSLEYIATPPDVQFTPEVYNRPEVHQAFGPSAGGVADARSVGRFFAMLANRGSLDGVRLLSEERVLSMLTRRPGYHDADETYGRAGFNVGLSGLHLSLKSWPLIDPPTAGARIMCHPGSGGTLGWADLDTGVSLAICHNRLFYSPSVPPYMPLVEAIYEAALGR